MYTSKNDLYTYRSVKGHDGIIKVCRQCRNHDIPTGNASSPLAPLVFTHLYSYYESIRQRDAIRRRLTLLDICARTIVKDRAILALVMEHIDHDQVAIIEALKKASQEKQKTYTLSYTFGSIIPSDDQDSQQYADDYSYA